MSRLFQVYTADTTPGDAYATSKTTTKVVEGGSSTQLRDVDPNIPLNRHVIEATQVVNSQADLCLSTTPVQEFRQKHSYIATMRADLGELVIRGAFGGVMHYQVIIMKRGSATRSIGTLMDPSILSVEALMEVVDAGIERFILLVAEEDEAVEMLREYAAKQLLTEVSADMTLETSSLENVEQSTLDHLPIDNSIPHMQSTPPIGPTPISSTSGLPINDTSVVNGQTRQSPMPPEETESADPFSMAPEPDTMEGFDNFDQNHDGSIFQDGGVEESETAVELGRRADQTVGDINRGDAQSSGTGPRGVANGKKGKRSSQAMGDSGAGANSNGSTKKQRTRIDWQSVTGRHSGPARRLPSLSRNTHRFHVDGTPYSFRVDLDPFAREAKNADGETLPIEVSSSPVPSSTKSQSDIAVLAAARRADQKEIEEVKDYFFHSSAFLLSYWETLPATVYKEVLHEMSAESSACLAYIENRERSIASRKKGGNKSKAPTRGRNHANLSSYKCQGRVRFTRKYLEDGSEDDQDSSENGSDGEVDEYDEEDEEEGEEDE